MCDFFESLRSTSALIWKQKFLVFCTTFCLLFYLETAAQTNTWDGSSSNNWNTAANWSLNLVPTAAHDVVIPNGFNVTVNTAAVCLSFTIAGGGTNNTVTISGSNSLTVTNNVSIESGTGNGDLKHLNVADGTLSCESIVIAAAAGFNRGAELSVSTGTINVTGDITMGDGFVLFGTPINDITFDGNGTINVGGDFTGGVLNAGTGTVNYNGSNQLVGAYDYNNLSFNGSGDAFVEGDLSISGDFTNNNPNTLDFTGSKVTLDGTGAQAIGGTSSTTFDDLYFDGSGTKSFDITTTISGIFNIANGVVADLGTFDHTTNSISFDNIGQVSGIWGSSSSSSATNFNDVYFAATTGGIEAAIDGPTFYYTRTTGNWSATTTWSNEDYNGAAASSIPSTGDIVYIGGGDYTITVDAGAECLDIIFLEGSASEPVLTIASGITLDVVGEITMPRGGSSFFNLAGNTLTVGDGILNAGSFSFTGGELFGDYRINIGAGTFTVTGDVTSDVFLNFPVIEFTGGAGELILGGAFLEADVVTLTTNGNGTIEYNGTVDQEISNFTYNNLILSGSGNKTVAGALDINGNLTLSSGITFVAESFTHTIAGNWINNGATFSNTGSTIEFDGTVAQFILGSQATNFHNLSLSGTNSVTFGYSTDISATLNINASATADLFGILTHSAKTLAFDGGGQIPGTWGSTSSAATNQNDTYFSSTGIITVTNTIYYAAANGNWNTATSWSTVDYGDGTNTATYPVTGDIAMIGGNYTITVAADANCAFVEYETGVGNTNTVTINNGATLTVSDAVNIPSLDGDTNIMNVSAGTLNSAELVFSPDDGGTPVSQLSISTGTATISGDMVNRGPDFLGDRTSAYINFSGAGLLQVAGEFVSANDGELTASTGTIEYNGSDSQTIADFTYYNLTLNNTAVDNPLTAAGNITVTQSLLMNAGVVDLDGNTFTLGSGGTSALFRTASSITNWFHNGSFERYWPASTAITSNSGSHYGLFPIGSDTDYRPMEFNSTVAQTGAGVINVTHTHRESVTELSPYYDDNGTDIEVKDNSSFIVTNTATGGTYDVSVSMTDYGASGNISDIRLAKNAGATSVNAVGTHAAATGTAEAPTGNRTAVTSAQLDGDWRITSTDIDNTPLPVDLLSFHGSFTNEQVILGWSTASELNNDYFELEHSVDGSIFNKIATISGHGTTNELSEYTFDDSGYVQGINYYRLKQVDFDGKSEVFNPIAISTSALQQAELTIYPNPTKGNLHIRLDGFNNQNESSLTIVDHLGKVVYHEILPPATQLKTLDNLGTVLVPGIYILNVQSGTENLRRKLAIQL
ncbi:MAG: T9SS type A sorting domain-containing protein [Reichenbachiella sp.]|uniref:T9SS type A sorting domain-containing protein n=1 Tax=Reichenbachiella sp. TaxID=2184521 RepID=UPI0029673353|nr:T9SS type A sorting domain-containing protein [Reichenbachiella sp.]MDW3210636.1 T9SS type A sorting domain-containing protein [Reichenbachiella sp.]